MDVIKSLVSSAVFQKPENFRYRLPRFSIVHPERGETTLPERWIKIGDNAISAKIVTMDVLRHRFVRRHYSQIGGLRTLNCHSGDSVKPDNDVQRPFAKECELCPAQQGCLFEYTVIGVLWELGLPVLWHLNGTSARGFESATGQLTEDDEGKFIQYPYRLIITPKVKQAFGTYFTTLKIAARYLTDHELDDLDKSLIPFLKKYALQEELNFVSRSSEEHTDDF